MNPYSFSPVKEIILFYKYEGIIVRQVFYHHITAGDNDDHEIIGDWKFPSEMNTTTGRPLLQGHKPHLGQVTQ